MEVLQNKANQLDQRVLGPPLLERLHQSRTSVALAAGNVVIALAGLQTVVINAHHSEAATVCVQPACGELSAAPEPLQATKRPEHHAAPKPTSVALPKAHHQKPVTHHSPPHEALARVSPTPKSHKDNTSQARANFRSSHTSLLESVAKQLLTRLFGKSELGYDIGQPQCDKKLPPEANFAILSLFAGYPGRIDNACLSHFLRWAMDATPGQDDKRIGYYINVSDPGPKGNLWPRDNRDPSGRPVKNPYGACNGDNSLACSEQYGYDMAWRANHQAFRVSAAAVGLKSGLAHRAVFMDIEGEGKGAWETGPDAQAHNQAAVIGDTRYLLSIKAVPGVYGSEDVVPALIGPVKPGTPLYGLPEWHAQGAGHEGAKAVCEKSWVDDGPIWFGQFTSHGIDVDVNCQAQ